MEKRMQYRVYKKQFPDCKTLGDYDASDKTITVVIPDGDARVQRQKRLNGKEWKSLGNEWRMLEPLTFGFRDTSFRVQRYEDGFYVGYLIPCPENTYSGFRSVIQEKTKCASRDEAIAIVESNWKTFKEYLEARKADD